MKTVTVSATTLFHVAARELGDATQWIRIAQENGLSDPMVHEVTDLRIPVLDPTLSGGLAAQ